MDLELSEAQQILRTTSRELLTAECPLTLVRQMEDDTKGYSQDLWENMAELGWLALVFPEKYGGIDSNFLDLSVLLEEMGRALVPGPFFSTVVLGGLTLLDCADESVKANLIPKICAGELLMTLALTETSGTYQLDSIETEASYQNGQFMINGTKLFVTDAHVAELLILVARTQNATEQEDGLTLFLVPSNSQGITITPHHSIASDKQSEITLENVQVSPDAIIGKKNMGGGIITRALERGAIARCMEMLGGAEAVLEMTVEYTKQRTQFGQPIGSFQAVQHHCANMAIDVDASRLIAYQAAWKLSEGLPASREVAMAKAWISNAYLRICALANLCHGAISFTKEHDLQLYTRRARVQEQSMGDSTFHLKLLEQDDNKP